MLPLPHQWYQSHCGDPCDINGDKKTFKNKEGSSYGGNFQQLYLPLFSSFGAVDGESYDYWSIQMKTLFISQDLWELVENGYDAPEDATALAT